MDKVGWRKVEEDLLVVKWINETSGKERVERKRVRIDCPLTREEVKAYVERGMTGLVRYLLGSRPTLSAHGLQHLILEATRGQGPHTYLVQANRRNGRPRQFVQG